LEAFGVHKISGKAGKMADIHEFWLTSTAEAQRMGL
jgi:hypothetical protein